MKYLLGEKLQFDWKVVTITILSTLLLMIDHYHKFTSTKYWDRVILYLLIPLIIRLENRLDHYSDWYFVHGSDYLLFGAR